MVGTSAYSSSCFSRAQLPGLLLTLARGPWQPWSPEGTPAALSCGSVTSLFKLCMPYLASIPPGTPECTPPVHPAAPSPISFLPLTSLPFLPFSNPLLWVSLKEQASSWKINGLE